MLEVKIIQSAEKLEETERIWIKHALWGTEYLPETYGYLGYVSGEGFYVKMVCRESDPIRKFTENRSPVCLDSAMEVFLQLPADTGFYVNFEVNANGAVLAEYGAERTGRTMFSEEMIARLCCTSRIIRDTWEVCFKIPQDLLEDIYGSVNLQKDSVLFINLFKVCEGAKPCHYGAYAYIPVEPPCFHLPEYYEKVILV